LEDRSNSYEILLDIQIIVNILNQRANIFDRSVSNESLMPRTDAAARLDAVDRPLLETRGLVKQFGGMRAVDDVSISLYRGELLGLIGPNGAGKTTLFNLIAGSLRPTSGEIRIGGVDVSRERAEWRLGRGIGRTFQIPRPFAEMTVLENVLTGGQDQAGERHWMNFLQPRRVAAEEKAAVEKARGLLEFLQLAPLALQPARILSGGQRKLLELARILMADPQAILLDEPAAGVNPTLLELIIDRVRTLHAEGRTILLIEHNMDMVSRLCSRVVVMAAGRRLTEGTPSQVARDPSVIQAYLGDTA
jgi:branched-chain amino acid transport system ATP-binding protein